MLELWPVRAVSEVLIYHLVLLCLSFKNYEKRLTVLNWNV